MKNFIDLKDRVCDKCKKDLAAERIVKAPFYADKCYCEKCADGLPYTSIHTYINMNKGEAMLALDNNAYEEVVKTAKRAFGGEWLTVRNITLDMISPEREMLLVIELYDLIGRPLPQQRLIDENPLVRKIVRDAQNSDERVVLSPRVSGIRCLCYKTDSCGDTYECLPEMGRLLSGLKPRPTVYMERCSNDPNDAARLMLAGTGLKCVYCTGEKRANTSRGIFTPDFTQKELFDYCRTRIIGQDKELNTAVFLVYDYLDKLSQGKKPSVKNWLLTAPSGMGKTEFYRCLSDFFAEHNVPVPVIRFDLSQITETGFKGKNMDVILSAINSAEPRHRRLPRGAAICFLDEADKKFVPSYDSKNVNISAAVQSNLLTLIEGSVMPLTDEGGTLDTSDTMFVFLGAFQNMRDKKKEDAEALREIFGEDGQCGEEDSFYGDLNFDDVISFGLLEELAGRISMIVNFRKLPEEDMRRLIDEKARLTGEEFGVRIRLTKSGSDDLLSEAYGNLGIRTPVNRLKERVIAELARRSLGSGPFDSIREEIVIDSKTGADIRPGTPENEI